ncbi:hypothetical protein CR970_00105 [Candidatus Saccharibacteria bacterium]|nr:MAG: hypothetical protein CR970_00105 [Candidatus Saccharibacteria bacterium]
MESDECPRAWCTPSPEERAALDRAVVGYGELLGVFNRLTAEAVDAGVLRPPVSADSEADRTLAVVKAGLTARLNQADPRKRCPRSEQCLLAVSVFRDPEGAAHAYPVCPKASNSRACEVVVKDAYSELATAARHAERTLRPTLRGYERALKIGRVFAWLGMRYG